MWDEPLKEVYSGRCIEEEIESFRDGLNAALPARCAEVAYMA